MTEQSTPESQGSETDAEGKVHAETSRGAQSSRQDLASESFTRIGQGVLPGLEGAVFVRRSPDLSGRNLSSKETLEIHASEERAREKYAAEMAEQRELDASARLELAAWLKDRRALRDPEARGIEVAKVVMPHVLLDSSDLQVHLDQVAGSRHAHSDPEMSYDTVESVEEIEGRLDTATRISYTKKLNDSRTQKLEGLASNQIWNAPFDGQHNIRLHWHEAGQLRQSIDEWIDRQGDRITVILPFAKEPDTVQLAGQYSTDLVGGANVIPVSAGYDDTSEAAVEQILGPQGVALEYQAKILGCVDWEKVCELCAIPVRHDASGENVLPPKGTKGLTMFAGLLAAEVRGGLEETTVFFHDTDIANCWDYDALRYLALPYALSEADERPFAAMIGKTGPGRNNQGWTNTMNLIAAEEGTADFARRIARVAGTTVWPLSGERAFDGDFLRRAPWTTGMSVETQLDLLGATEVVKNNRPRLSQVMNGVKKVENGLVDEVREWDMMQMCAAWGAQLLGFASREKIFPVDLGVEHIRKFNMTYGGVEVDNFHQSPVDGPNRVTTSTSDYMIPSVKQLAELELIDWERLRQVTASQ